MPYYETPLNRFLTGSYTVDSLPAPTSSMVGKYALVTDLFGEKTDYVLCSQAGSTYFWQPVRPTYTKTVSADQNMTLTPLKSPSVLYLSGTLLANRTFNLSSQLVYPGAAFEIAFDGSLGVFGLTVSNLILGQTLSMTLGGRRRFFYDADAGGWKQFQ